MKLGIILTTGEAEKSWNALRFANTALELGHAVKLFLLNDGVEAEHINSEPYNVSSLIEKYSASGGIFLACGTCLQSRNLKNQTTSIISTMIESYSHFWCMGKIRGMAYPVD